MTSQDLNGFDVVVHLAEEVINQGLELLPNGSTFPVRQRDVLTPTVPGVPTPGIGNPLQDVSLVYDAFVELERPQIELDQAAGRVIVRCDLSPASQLTFLQTDDPADISLLTAIVPQIPIAGTVELTCPFAMGEVSAVWANQAVAGMAALARAGAVSATLSLTVLSADSAGDVQLATSTVDSSALTLSSAAIESAIEDLFGNRIGNEIGDLPLTTPVRLNSGARPHETVRELQGRISPAGSPPAISLGVLTAIDPPRPGGSIPAPAATLDTAGAVILVSNYWTIHLVASGLTAAHPAMQFSFNPNTPSGTFNGAVTVNGGEEPIRIEELKITVNTGGGLFIDGFATASGGCWDADITFDFVFTFACDPDTGDIVAATSEPNVDGNVDKDLVCQLIGFVIGALGGFLVGAVIGFIAGGGPGGALVGGIIGGVAGGIGGFLAAGYLIDPLDLEGVSLDSLSVLGGLTLPLPVGGAGILTRLCDFDDLSLACDLAYVDLAERHRSGSVTLAAGNGFDFDAGVTRAGLSAGTDDPADLLWTGTTLQTLPGATRGPVFASDSSAFDTLSLTDLQRFDYAAANISLGGGFPTGVISAAAIPMMLPIDIDATPKQPTGAVAWPDFGRPRTVSFALRTDEGRYAKCRAHRDTDGNVTIEYVVYAREEPCLGSVVTVETLDTDVVEAGTQTCTEVRTERPPLAGLDWTRFQPPSKPIAWQLHTLEPAAVPSMAASPARDLAASARVFKQPDLFELPDRLAPVKPKPRRPCGEHKTIEHDEIPYQLVDRKQRLIVRALPSGMPAPLTYRWTVFGTDLPPGAGTMTIDSVDVTYNENSPMLTIVADFGQDVVGSIIIKATDADGRTLRTTRSIRSPSRKRLGKCCPDEPAKLTVYDAALRLEQLGDAQRVLAAGLMRHRKVASKGRLIEADSVSLETAVAALKLDLD